MKVCVRFVHLCACICFSVSLKFLKGTRKLQFWEGIVGFLCDRISVILLADFDLHRHDNVTIGILDVLLLCWLCNVLWGGGWGSVWDVCELERSKNFWCLPLWCSWLVVNDCRRTKIIIIIVQKEQINQSVVPRQTPFHRPVNTLYVESFWWT